LILVFGLFFSCGEAGVRSLAVGSKIDTEGALLGNMIRLVLEDEGFQVENKIQTGPTNIVRQAIISGEIDIYPEYTGNGFFFFSGESEAEIWKDFEEGWETVKALDLQANNLQWLRPAPANNTWAIALRADLAQANSLETLEDLGNYLKDGGAFKIAASEEFVTSEAALPSFEKAYGFSLGEDQTLILSGGNTTLTAQAAASGRDGVNAAMAYGTDGQLDALNLVVLEDTLKVQPVYAPAPIVRAEILAQFPEIEELLNPVFQSLDLVTLQKLNSQIAVEGQNAAQVAESYLRDQGFLR